MRHWTTIDPPRDGPSKPSVTSPSEKKSLPTYGHDKYGRTIADVLLPDSTNINHAQVKEG
jgi:endonuclease YncB( thermonuclease family)